MEAWIDAELGEAEEAEGGPEREGRLGELVEQFASFVAVASAIMPARRTSRATAASRCPGLGAVSVADLPLQNLAGRASREPVDEVDPLGDLERSEPVAAERADHFGR